MRNGYMLMAAAGAAVWAAPAFGQSSSLLRRPAAMTGEQAAVEAPAARTTGSFDAAPLPEQARPSTRAIESVSMFAVPPTKPRRFKVNDLVTVIVRQHKKYEADAEYEKKKKWDIDGKLTEWFRFHQDWKHLGTDQLSNGQPGFAFGYDDKYQTDGQRGREDEFTTRIQARVIDVKPNGNLVIEARSDEEHEGEKYAVTLTGECRSEDVTPANSVLSSQVADLALVVTSSGSVADATKRGWIPRLLDFAKPF